MTRTEGPADVQLVMEKQIAHVTLLAPHRANALSEAVVARLREAIEKAEDDGAVVLVLRSSGRTFCGGFDLGDVAAVQDSDLKRRFIAVERLLAALRDSSMLTVAVVEGAAIGAGADLVASCDFRIGTEAAKFRFPGPRFGLLLGSAHLANIVKGPILGDLLVRNLTITGAVANDAGLLTHLVAPEELERLVLEVSAAPLELSSETLDPLLQIIRGRPVAEPMVLMRQSVSPPGLSGRLKNFMNKSTVRE